MKKIITVFTFLFMLQQLSFAVVSIENEPSKQENKIPTKKRITIRDIFKLKKRIKKVKREQRKGNGLSSSQICFLVALPFIAGLVLSIVYLIFPLIIILSMVVGILFLALMLITAIEGEFI
jgi:Flp pilus assembly protein TadB